MLLTVRRQTRTRDDGRVVDYSYSYFLPGYFHFHVVRRGRGSEFYRLGQGSRN
ncbi:MAG: hypothetical protein M0C28_17420 [Candidatus Moduliflexus flocculans]|nr:hypothetical protein [Candidatus Moduliflexus flocculans]